MAWGTASGEHFLASNPPSLKASWQVINLALDFGLSTTGTDAITRIQSAIAAAPASGWSLFMPPGTYPDNSGAALVPGRGNIALVGAGRRVSVIKPTVGITYPVIQIGDATHPYANFLFQDFSIDPGGGAPGFSGGGIGMYFWNASFVDVLRVDVLRTGDHAVQWALGNTVRFRDVTVGQNGGGGWNLQGGAYIWIDRCMADSVQLAAGVQNTGADAVWLLGSTIFGGGRDGVQHNFAQTVGFIIDHCAIYGNCVGQGLNAYAAVHLGGSSSGLVVQNSRLTNDTVNQNSSGVILDAGAANATIEGNDLRLISAGPNTLTDNSGTTSNTIRRNKGYNPIGVVAPGVPASTVATPAVNYDRTFYITTGAGATTMVIQNGPTVTLQASVAGQSIRVPAGKSLTPTYANPPTWVVEGE